MGSILLSPTKSLFILLHLLERPAVYFYATPDAVASLLRHVLEHHLLIWESNDCFRYLPCGFSLVEIHASSGCFALFFVA